MLRLKLVLFSHNCLHCQYTHHFYACEVVVGEIRHDCWKV